MQSMTYGQLPTARDFKRHLRTARDEMGAMLVSPEEPAYWMELVGDDAEVFEHAAGSLPGVTTEPIVTRHGFEKLRVQIKDVDTLYVVLASLVHHYEDGNDAAGDLASGMMSTLGYEWI